MLRTTFKFDSVKAVSTGDPWPSSDDEVYFTIVGTTEWIYLDTRTNEVTRGRGTPILPERIAPAGPKDYFEFADNTVHSNIILKHLDLNLASSPVPGRAFGHRCNFFILIAEQDSSFGEFIHRLLTITVGGIDKLLSKGLKGAADLVPDLISGFGSVGDDVIGAIRIQTYVGLPHTQQLPFMASVKWIGQQGASIVGSNPSLNPDNMLYDRQTPTRSQVQFKCLGGGANYDINASFHVEEVSRD